MPQVRVFQGKALLPFFSLSLAVPQFGLLSHISSLRLSSGHSCPVLTLSMHCKPPCSAPACWWQMQVSWATCPLGVNGYVHILCFLFFSSQLFCPLRLPNSPQTCPGEGFLVFGNFSFLTPSLGWVSIANCFVSVFFFYILSYLFLKRIH